MPWRTVFSRRNLFSFVIVGAVLAAVAVLGPMWLKALTPDRLAATNTWIDRIWWPATGLRGAVYGVLAFVIYPLWVSRHARAPRARLQALPPVGVNPQADQEREGWMARLEHLTRAARRGPWVLLGFLISDGVLAQFPYWFLRG